MTVFRPRPRMPLAILAAALLSLALPAQADTYQDIGKLMKARDFSQALDKADRYLAANPKDPQARFMRALILTELGRTNDAIAAFTKLTEEFPESPEPYNNLAVIYAQQKQFDKARESLETAIRTHPSYATAHENLGDIYAHMASQAYDKALQIDSSNASAQTKLAMIRDMMTSARPTQQGQTKPTGKPAAIASATPTPPPSVPSIVKTETGKPAAATGTTTGDAAANNDTAEIGKTIAAWAAAWSKKDVKSYLAFYASDFETPGGQARAEWEAERNKRIDKPGAIEVSVENLKATMNGPDRAMVKFHQNYKAATLKSSGSKTMTMVRQDGKWLIKQEQAGK